MWSRLYIERTGKIWRRGRLEWDRLAMSADERRSLWRFTETTLAHRPPAWRPPNGEMFICQHWEPELRRMRAERRPRGVPSSSAELLGELLGGAP